MTISTKDAILGYLEKQGEILIQTLRDFCTENGICDWLPAMKELIEEGKVLLIREEPPRLRFADTNK